MGALEGSTPLAIRPPRGCRDVPIIVIKDRTCTVATLVINTAAFKGAFSSDVIGFFELVNRGVEKSDV
jgi:hypothetical protein